MGRNNLPNVPRDRACAPEIADWRSDELFRGAGAFITNLSRFGDWERWGYDWHLDVEQTLVNLTQRAAGAALARRPEGNDSS